LGRARGNSMIREGRMGNLRYGLLGHVAAGAIVRRSFGKPRGDGHRAAFLRVARQAFASKVGRSLPCRGLIVRIVAGNASQPAPALQETLTQTFGYEVLKQRVAGRFTAADR